MYAVSTPFDLLLNLNLRMATLPTPAIGVLVWGSCPADQPDGCVTCTGFFFIDMKINSLIK